ncbi:hypothetical protein DASC09_029000 [Saccharomycopsis crataegensis]|uniref:Ras-GAP domain-containing protein n=1 Tax=Saccharomycopsis crataegensis TaxID=43959 RepID=A0AAV5QKS5_9ASCO|nr:hypothetical protein DASC09_029000 [Saccharomycopsis crataegensis]
MSEPPACVSKFVSASFNRLEALLERFMSEEMNIDDAIADKSMVAINNMIAGLGTVEIQNILTEFLRLLRQYDRNESTSFLILYCMNSFVDSMEAVGTPKRTLPYEITLGLVEQLMKCHSCHDTRLYLSIYLNIVPKESPMIYQHGTIVSDNYAFSALKFINEIDRVTYGQIVTKVFVTTFSRNVTDDGASSVDAGIVLLESKSKYGFLECATALSARTGVMSIQIKSAMGTIRRFKASPSCQFATTVFGIAPISKWMRESPTEFLAYDFNDETTREVFELVYHLFLRQKLDSPKKPIHHMLPMLSYGVLTLYVSFKPQVMAKFLQFASNNKESLHMSEFPEQLDSAETKMFTVLAKLADLEKVTSIDDKHLILKCYSILLGVAVHVEPLEPQHPLVLFTRKYMLKVFEAIEDVCFSVSTSTTENSLVESSKIDFITFIFMLAPEEIFPVFDYYIKNYLKVDLYGYYIITCAIKKLQSNKLGLILMEKYFYNIEYFQNFITTRTDLVKTMKLTEKSHMRHFMKYPTQRAHLSEYQILGPQDSRNKDTTNSTTPNKSTSNMHFGFSLHNSGNRIQKHLKGNKKYETGNQLTDPNFEDATIEDENFLTFPGFLSRRVYQVSVDILNVSPIELLKSEPLFVKDSVLLSDENLFDEVTDEISDRGFFFGDAIMGGLFDHDVMCSEKSINFLLNLLSNETLLAGYRYYMFSANLNFTTKIVNLLLRHALEGTHQNTRQIVFVFEYMVKFISLYPGKIDRARYFSDLSHRRSRLNWEATKVAESFCYVYLCGATSESYTHFKDLLKGWVVVLNQESSIKSNVLMKVNAEFMKAIATDKSVIIRGQRYMFNKAKKLFMNNVPRKTEALDDVAVLISEKIEGYFNEEFITDKEKLVKFENYSTFMAIVAGLDISIEPTDQMNSLQENDTYFKFVEKMFRTLSSPQFEKRKIAEALLSESLHSNIVFYLYILIDEVLQKLQAPAAHRMLSTTETGTITSYATILDRLSKRLPELVLFGQSTRIFQILDCLVDIVKNQYSLLTNGKIQKFQNETQLMEMSLNFSKMKLSVIKFVASALKQENSLRMDVSYVLWKNALTKIFGNWLMLSFFRNEFNFFTKLRRSCAEVNSVPQSKIDGYIGKMTNVYKEIVLELLSCLQLLTTKLFIIKSNINFAVEVDTVRSLMFGNYYSSLMRILKKTFDSMKASGSSNTRPVTAYGGKNTVTDSRNNNDNDFLKVKYSDAENKKISERIIGILSNLIRLNYDVGSNYVLSLLTDSNSELQTTFLQIFKNIFDRDEFVNLGSFKGNVYEFMRSSITRLDVLGGISEVVDPKELDRVSNSMYHLLSATGELVGCLQKLIQYDLQSLTLPIDLFRKNNFTTKLLSLVTKDYGTEFLRCTVGVVLKRLIEEEEYFDDSESVVDHSTNFFKYYRLLTETICGSIDKLPPIIKSICFSIRAVVFESTNDDALALNVVKSFLFSRFICPAVAHPEQLGLVKEKDVTVARKKSFIILTRSLQSTVNNSLDATTFSSIKGHESQIGVLIAKTSQFVIDAASKQFLDAEIGGRDVSSVSMQDIRVFCTFSVEHSRELRHSMLNCGLMNHKGRVSELYQYFKTFDESFTNTRLQFFTYYPDVANYIAINKDKHPEIYQLVSEALKNPIYEKIINASFLKEGISKDGNQVFVFNLKEFVNYEHIDSKILAARFLQALCQMSTSQFYLIVDCTLYNEPECIECFEKMMTHLVSITSNELADKCGGVFIVNVSDVFSGELAVMIDDLSQTGDNHRFMNPRFNKFSFLTVFEDYDIINSLDLSEQTYSVVNGGKNFINDILLFENEKVKPMNLKFTNSHIMYSFANSKKFKIGTMTKYLKTVNIEPLNDWTELRELDNDPGMIGTFQTHSRLFDRVMKFSSLKRSEIIRTFYLSLNGAQTTMYNNQRQLMKSSKVVDMKEFLGEVLISIGTGLLNNDPEVRKHAYDLLCMVAKHIKISDPGLFFEIGPAFSPPKSSTMVRCLFVRVAKDNPELVRQIVSAFVFVMNAGDGWQGLGSGTYDIFWTITPWIDFVCGELSDDPELIHTFILSIIRNFPKSQGVFMTFNMEIWSHLICDEQLVEMIVDDVIGEILNRKLIFAGADCDKLMSLLTVNSSIKVCAVIINQLLEGTKLSKTMCDQHSRMEFYWIKIEFLLEACLSLLFDNLYFVEQFLPKVMYICSIYHRTGTIKVKTSIMTLFINCLNSLRTNGDFFEKPSIEVIDKIILDLRGSQAEYIFGLNLSDELTNTGLGKQTIQEFHGDFVTSRTINSAVIEILCLPEYSHRVQSDAWVSALTSLSYSLAFNKDSVYQVKGLRLLGQLGSLGISDHFLKIYLSEMVSFMELLADKEDSFDMAKLMVFFMNLGDLVTGLQKDSIYLELIVWIAVVLSFTGDLLISETGFFIFAKISWTIQSKNTVFSCSSIWDIVNSTRTEFRSMAVKYLSPAYLKLGIDNNVSVVVLNCKLLLSKQVTYFFKYAIDIAVMKLLSVRKSRSIRGYGLDLDSIAPMVPFYIGALSFEEFDAIMVRAGFEPGENYVEIRMHNRVPLMLLKFLCSESRCSIVVLITISKLFTKAKLAMKVKTRFLELMEYLFERSAFVTKIVFPIIGDTLLGLCQGPQRSEDVVEMIQNLQRRWIVVSDTKTHRPSSGEDPLLVARIDTADGMPLHLKYLKSYGLDWDSLNFDIANNEKFSDISKTYNEFHGKRFIFHILKYKIEKDEYVF